MEHFSSFSQGSKTTGRRRGELALTEYLAPGAVWLSPGTNHLSPVADEISPEIVNKHTFLEPFDIVMVSKNGIIFFLVIYFCGIL